MDLGINGRKALICASKAWAVPVPRRSQTRCPCLHQRADKERLAQTLDELRKPA